MSPLIIVLPVLAALAAPSLLAATLPPGFSDNPVANIGAPTALAFTPDGRLLIATQPGALRVHANNALLPTPAYQFPAGSICTSSERGLLGVAIDPNFGFNGYVYLYYTANKPAGCRNRVSRFTLSGSSQINAVSEAILLDDIPSPAGNHNGGDLHVGFDGLLYVSVGDGGCSIANGGNCAGANDNARFLSNPLGKILRVARDGSIPASNPYASVAGSRRCADPAGPVGGNGPCREIFAHGLRNPFRIAFRQGTDDFYINDVGQDVWEEIDRGLRGADYGWNLREGPCVNGSATNCPPPPAGLTDPIYAYTHGGGCTSITGGAFVPKRRWPYSLNDYYLFADFVCGTMFSLSPANAAATFGTNFGSASLTALVVGPSATGRSVYYTTYAGGGALRRIDYVGTPAFARNDYNGDARSDLTWWRSDGTLAIWILQSLAIASSATYVLPPEWVLVAGGDFNGDGRGDLLFRRSTDGLLFAWLMNGGAIAGTWASAFADSSYSFAGVADVNGDGADDIVLRSPLGDATVLITPTAYRPAWTSSYPIGTVWSLAGKGDLNGDGNDDLVWRRSDGTTAVWFMSGRDILASAAYAPGPEWSLRGLGDVDGNGKADLVWRRNDGTVVVWFMDGAAIVSSALYPQTTAWNVVGLADFNGDGRSDIVWRNVAGDAAIWLMNGAAITGAVSYPVGTSWTVVQ